VAQRRAVNDGLQRQGAPSPMQQVCGAVAAELLRDVANIREEVRTAPKSTAATPPGRQFSPSMKWPRSIAGEGILVIAHLTRECGGNMHYHEVVEVISSAASRSGDAGWSG
jgi:hypothetical protein